jgi:hypothetical protein
LEVERKFRFTIEIPLTAWLVRSATHLDEDYAVFQLGNDQIYLLHPERKQIALIARGKSPVAAKSPAINNSN